ncbi:MAG: CheA-like two-component hybrid sensor and regulator [Bacteroidetes bacterium]|nr:CheA-like two-component hybrid sensor and regulator [Bacteroidota bacterium]
MYLYHNILLIDDETDDLTVLVHTFKGLSPSLTFTTADSALYGLAKLRSLPDLDLILVDLNMPGMDGFQFLEALRFEPHYKNTPCIMWTSSVDDIHRKRAMELGAAGFYIKPTDTIRLKKMLHDILLTDFSKPA